MADHLAANPSGETNNYNDLSYYLDHCTDADKEGLGISDAETIDDWIEIWQGEAETQKNFILKVNCVAIENVVEAAMKMVAVSIVALAFAASTF